MIEYEYVSNYLNSIRGWKDGGDLVDRLNYEYTTLLLVLSALTLAGKQYVGEPIQCWFPAEFTEAWEAYAKSYCFAKNTYFLSITDDIPDDYDERRQREIGYYQWVPLMLLLQAFFFSTPLIIWKSLHSQSDDERQLSCASFSCSVDAFDPIDRLSNQYTSLIFILAGFVHLGKNIGVIGDAAIQCWVPADFTDSWELYAENYCYAQSTYRINVKSVLDSAASIKKKLDKETRDAQVEMAAKHITESLNMQRELKTRDCFGFLCYGKHNGLYVTGLYLFTKLLYVINVVAQLFILNAFLGTQYMMWGYGILNDLANGREWHESGHFPRVTMCDFSVRMLGNIHRWTVQCVLMINMYNEKIYLLFWWWFMVIGFLSILSLFYWTYETVSVGKQQEFLNKYLRVTGAVPAHPGPKEKRLMNNFMSQSLRPDGVLLLRLIQTNGGDLLTGEIVNKLYEQYRIKYD